jgi:hypothetical protein
MVTAMKRNLLAARSRTGARVALRRLVHAALACQAAALVLGCPSGRAKESEPPATCTKAGDACTFSPGKLGVCVDSVDGSRLVCQSLH